MNTHADSTVRLNQVGLDQARTLIEKGEFVRDLHGDWSEPTREAGNELVAAHGYAAYGAWHLGVDPQANPDTKGAYSFPYGDYTRVYRSGLLAVQERAAQYGHRDIEAAAKDLLALLDEAAEIA